MKLAGSQAVDLQDIIAKSSDAASRYFSRRFSDIYETQSNAPSSQSAENVSYVNMQSPIDNTQPAFSADDQQLSMGSREESGQIDNLCVQAEPHHAETDLTLGNLNFHRRKKIKVEADHLP
jgi:hypothetical protein